MSRLIVKLCVAFTICLATAAVGFAQRQPASSAGKKPAGDAGATTAADRGESGQGHRARATFEVYKDKAGEYRWRLRATNTQIIAIASQGYSDKRSCTNAIESVKRDVVDAPVEEKEIPLKNDGKAGTIGGADDSGGTTAGASTKKPAKSSSAK